MEELLKENLLKKNYYKLLRMHENKNKAILTAAYYSLLSFLSNGFGDEFYFKYNLDPDTVEKFDYYLFADTCKNLDIIDNNALKLKEVYEKIIKIYKDNEFCECDHLWLHKVNQDKMMDALYDFFAYLGDDVLKIYQSMLDGDNLFLNSGPMDRIGMSIDPTPIDNYCAMFQNAPNYFDFYETVAHEIGHCYQFYLQSGQKIISSLCPCTEVTSMLFEKLFIDFLKNNYIIKSELPHQLEDHIVFLNYVCISKAICRLFLEDKKLLVEPYQLCFQTKMDISELEKEIISDCGYIDPPNKDFELYDLHYSIGGIISTYFFHKIKEDFASGWKEFKDFICTVNYLPFDEVIDKYLRVDLVEKDVKTLTKSYRER